MSEVPTHRVDVIFTYNLPANELEIAQMINYLKDIATDETLLGRLPFVSDAKEEAALARQEKAANMESEMDAMDHRDYDKPIRDDDEE